MNLKEIKSTRKEPNEVFHFKDQSLKFNILDFWSWNQSDLIENRNRGILAEFLVRQALEIQSSTRLEWDAYDLITEKGVKIEVKSAAFIQAWEQKGFSAISFGIKPTKTLLPDNNYSSGQTRHADIYIFCLLHHKNQDTINPMKLDQWTFYLVSKATLDKEFPIQQSIGISTIETIPHEKCNFLELKDRFEKINKRLD